MAPPTIPDTDGTLFIDTYSDPGSYAEVLPFLVNCKDDSPVRVLVACEYSAVVRDAFRARGFDAWSCDLLPTEGDPRWHIQGDAIEVAYGQHWDLLIAHPPCTDLAVSGARHFAAKIADGRQQRALDFVQRLLDAPIKHIALENPVSVISSKIRKPDCTYQPWQHGHGEVKRSCLWLKNLPVLKPSNIVEGREARVHKMPPGPDRWKERSRTLAGVANAMAGQWGAFISPPTQQPLGDLAKADCLSVSHSLHDQENGIVS